MEKRPVPLPGQAAACTSVCLGTASVPGCAVSLPSTTEGYRLVYLGLDLTGVIVTASQRTFFSATRFLHPGHLGLRRDLPPPPRWLVPSAQSSQGPGFRSVRLLSALGRGQVTPE